jgi:lysophospholipase L1-like esterase
VAGKSAARPQPQLSAAQRADLAAAAQARRTGRAVAVPSQTTPTMEVLAHPDGRFEFISTAQPVRVQVNGRWTPISVTLRRDRDGSWSAPLTTAPVRFSGGGSGPMVTVTNPATGRYETVWWPYRLPRPVVSGSAALYPDVLPGVGLRLEATATGYSEVLVVASAAAAADPRLRLLTFTLRGGPGVAVRPGPDGTTAAVDVRTKKTLFSSGQSVMWDSGRAGHIPATPSAGQAGSERIFSVPAHSVPSASGATMTLAPPAAALTGPKLIYPLYLDPQISDNDAQYYAEVASFGGYWNSSTNTTSIGGNAVEVGYCGYTSGSSPCVYEWDGHQYVTYTDRVYYRMDTSLLEERNGFNAQVYSATFYDDELTNSNGCVKQSVALWTSGAISSSTRWGGPEGSQISTASSDNGGGSGCKAGDVALDATSYVQGWNGSNLTFTLRAPDESDEYEYKTFSDNPSLDVYFNFAPLEPGGLSVSDAVTCTSTTYTSAAEPSMSATGDDNNPSPLHLDYNFTLDTSSGTQVSSQKLTDGGGGYSSGTAVNWDSEGSLTSGDSYKYDVYTTNVIPSGDQSSPRNSPTTGWYDFTDLSTPPSAAPAISSFDYPLAQWGQPAGAPGVFTVGTKGDTSIAGFTYSFDGGSGSEPTPSCDYLQDGGLGTSASGNGGGNGTGMLALAQASTTQIQIPSDLGAGQHTLFVRSFDDAHNLSPEAAYTFYVAPNYQTTSQPIAASPLLSEATGANASLLSQQAQTCCGVTTWLGGDQLLFNSSSAGETFTIPLTVPNAGTWQLGADMTTAPHYGDVAVYLDQSTSDINLGGTATTPFDGYNPVVSNSYLDLGTQTLTAGTHTLTFTITGQDPDSEGYQAGINYLTLSPTNRYEADSLTWSGTNTAGTLSQQCQAEPSWSDNCQLLLANTEQGTSFTVSFTVPVESDYALGVNLTTGVSYGKLRFDLDPATTGINLDATASEPIDTYKGSLSSQYVFLGAVHLTAGTHVLEVTVVGKDPSSTGDQYDAGLNYVESAPVTGATDASFTSAMNNLGLVSDGSSVTGRTGNFDSTNNTVGPNLSIQAMTDAGITPGTATGPGATFSLNGATFTMPQLSASGSTVDYDNVIPDGQTIPLPAVNATGVALLVSSTCGASPAATATLNYSNGGFGNAEIPSVPSWLSGPPSGGVMQLGYYDQGATPQSSAQPELFEVMLPADPDATLSSISLPLMTANFLPDSGECSNSPNVLHILAIGTRTVPAGPSGTVWTGAFDAPTDTSVAPSPAMTNQTLREVVPVSSDGSGSVRIHLSNAQSSTPVTFDGVTIAAQSSGPGTLATPQALTFGTSDSDSVTLPAGGDVWSNPYQMPSTTNGTGDLTVSLYVPSGETVASASIHDSPDLTTYWATGNDTTDQLGTDDFSSADSLTGLYYLTGVDVTQTATTDGTITVLGDQTATSAPAGTYGNWTSDLTSALVADSVAPPGSIVDASTDDGQPSDWWRMNGPGLDTSTTAYDDGSVGTNSLTLEGSPSPSWSTQTPGTGTSTGSLSLNGTSQYAQSAQPVITSTSSFAVSAWVNLSSLPTQNATVAAQDGATDSGFYLGYDAAHSGDWTFYFADSDTTSPSHTYVYGPAAKAGSWTNLVGVYNAQQGQIQLWVNGVEAGSTSFTPAWTASGGFTVGRDYVNGVDSDFFPGLISDVRAYNDTVIGPANVQEIYSDNGASSITTGNAATALEDDAADEPNLQDVIISLGANDALEGEPASQIETNLDALITNIENRFDAQGNPMQAFVTTIPPLGLSSADPREAVREAVNSWLKVSGSTAASAVFDIASAVDDGTNHQNLVNPSDLTNGVPNASYYSVIANAIASAAGPPVTLTPPKKKTPKAGS